MRAEHLAATLVNRNSMYNVQAYNQQAAAKNSTTVRGDERIGRKDRAVISPLQRANSMIEAVRKQKQSIIENKNQLVKNTMEAGKDIDTIQPQLDAYNELLQTLDEQIAGIITAVAQQKAAEAERLQEKAEAAKEEEPKTEEELQAEELSNIASATDSIKQSEVVSSVLRKTVGEAKVKQSEIMQSELSIDHLTNKKKNVYDMIATERRMINKKAVEVAELEDRAAALNSAESAKLAEATAKLEENHNQAQKAEQDPETKDNETEATPHEETAAE